MTDHPPRPAAAETAGKTPRPDGEIVAVLTGLNLSENGKKIAALRPALLKSFSR
jgi:hypothetical protein